VRPLEKVKRTGRSPLQLFTCSGAHHHRHHRLRYRQTAENGHCPSRRASRCVCVCVGRTNRKASRGGNASNEYMFSYIILMIFISCFSTHIHFQRHCAHLCFIFGGGGGGNTRDTSVFNLSVDVAFKLFTPEVFTLEVQRVQIL